jgi:hypothetical protein
MQSKRAVNSGITPGRVEFYDRCGGGQTHFPLRRVTVNHPANLQPVRGSTQCRAILSNSSFASCQFPKPARRFRWIDERRPVGRAISRASYLAPRIDGSCANFFRSNSNGPPV